MHAQRIRNQQVIGSSPIAGSNFFNHLQRSVGTLISRVVGTFVPYIVCYGEVSSPARLAQSGRAALL
jgi:hypothetical protein